jgi:hypothetical protein
MTLSALRIAVDSGLRADMAPPLANKAQARGMRHDDEAAP